MPKKEANEKRVPVIWYMLSTVLLDIFKCCMAMLMSAKNSGRTSSSTFIGFRDGQLEKLWGEGNFQAAEIFFITKFLV